jgi:hypothetical protein
VAQNTANADAVLKNYYLGPIREQLNQRAILMFAAEDEGTPESSTGENIGFRGISRESERVEFAGRQWVIPAHKSRNEGVGAIDEGGPSLLLVSRVGSISGQPAPQPGSHRAHSLRDPPVEPQPGAFIRLLEGETKGLVRDLRKDVNRQAWGVSDRCPRRSHGRRCQHGHGRLRPVSPCGDAGRHHRLHQRHRARV